MWTAESSVADSSHKLLVSGWIHLGPPGGIPAEVRREMSIVGSDGVLMGTVAAVVVDAATQKTTHILLCRPHPDLEYRLVPLTLIERVNADAVQLWISSPAAKQLPRRTTS